MTFELQLDIQNKKARLKSAPSKIQKNPSNKVSQAEERCYANTETHDWKHKNTRKTNFSQ